MLWNLLPDSRAGTLIPGAPLSCLPPALSHTHLCSQFCARKWPCSLAPGPRHKIELRKAWRPMSLEGGEKTQAARRSGSQISRCGSDEWTLSLCPCGVGKAESAFSSWLGPGASLPSLCGPQFPHLTHWRPSQCPPSS